MINTSGTKKGSYQGIPVPPEGQHQDPASILTLLLGWGPSPWADLVAPAEEDKIPPF